MSRRFDDYLADQVEDHMSDEDEDAVEEDGPDAYDDVEEASDYDLMRYCP